MKYFIRALIATCIGTLIIGLNTKEHNPPLPEQPTQAVVEAPVAPLPVEAVPEPIPVVEAIVEAPAPVYVAQEYPAVTDNEGKAFIYARESNNCPTRWQGEYGACPAYHGVPTDPNTGYGLCQSTPASKMAVMGPGWETSYELQDQWCTNYANSRYGGWANAYATWLRQRWW